jgi:hypothetical protein
VVQFSPSEVTGPNNFTIDLTDLNPNKTWYFAGHEQDMRHVQIGHLKLIGVKEEEYSYLSNDADNKPSDYLNLSKNIYISINGGEPVLASPESFKGVECNFDIRAKVPSSGREPGVYYLEDFGVTQPGRFTVSFYVYDGLEYSTGPIINLEYQPELALAKDENQSDKVEILTNTVKDNVGLSQQYLISATWGFYLETDVVNLGAEAILIQEGTRYILPVSSFGFYPNSVRK